MMVERAWSTHQPTRHMSPWDDIAGILDDPDDDEYYRCPIPRESLPRCAPRMLCRRIAARR